jgi:glycosyltransferase involved in cell wall biosynthesis
MLALWYQAADAYVHPARAETSGLMIAEALACGTAVIATSVGGIPEFIASAAAISGEHGGAALSDATGALVPAGDAASLARALTGFLALGDHERAALSENAARSARPRFDIRKFQREYLDWIRELASAKSLDDRM